MTDAVKRLAELEVSGTRRCLICANINPCREHSWEDQRAELARNDAEIAHIRTQAATLKGGE